MIFKNLIHFLCIASILILIQSCVPGYRAAQSFLRKTSTISVMVVPPPFTYLNYYPENPELFPPETDTVYDLEESFFLKDIQVQRADSLFMEALYGKLNALNVRVFNPDQFDVFFNQPDPKYIFTIAQSELLEYDDIYEQRALIDTLLYRKSFIVRTVSRNTWFEFVKVDNPDEEADMQVLYSNIATADAIDGQFRYRWMSGEVVYEYVPYLLNLNDIYELNRWAGVQNGHYIFEFLLNRYVEQNASYRFGQPVYLKYDPYRNAIRRGNDSDRFILMEP